MENYSGLGKYKILKSLRATIEDILIDTIEYLTEKFNQNKIYWFSESCFR